MLIKLISKKFIAFITGTLLLYYDKLSSTEWLIIASAYMGLEASLNVIEKLYKNEGDKK